MGTIKLKEPFVVVKEICSNEFEIIGQNDLPSLKKVLVTIRITTEEGPTIKEYTLWEGDKYNEIGQWSDDDVIMELEKILLGTNEKEE